MEGRNRPSSTSNSSVYIAVFEMTYYTNSRFRISLGRIAPAVVLICFLLDVSLRALPPKLIAFRGMEALGTFATGNGPFAHNGFYRNLRSYGDLANMGNFPQMRQYREDVFTTDAEGYRNRQTMVSPFRGILLLGDSFAVGSGVRDDQTLSEQLSNRSGCPVFNGGDSRNTTELMNHLHMPGGLVIWEQSERDPLPQFNLTPSKGKPIEMQSTLEFRVISRVLGVKRAEFLRQLKFYSPLQTIFSRAVRLIQNDRILPNPFNGVVEAHLLNGREILFLQSEIENYQSDRSTDPAYFAVLKTQLQSKGIRLLVLLVPDKYVVYYDLIMPPSPLPERRPFLDLVEERLAAADVPVVNLTPQFRENAKDLLARDQYLYWMDDTHWNAEGIREATQAIEESRTASELVCRAHSSVRDEARILQKHPTGAEAPAYQLR